MIEQEILQECLAERKPFRVMLNADSGMGEVVGGIRQFYMKQGYQEAVDRPGYTFRNGEDEVSVSVTRGFTSPIVRVTFNKAEAA